KETLVSGGRYRPMTLALFALVYQLFGENKFIFHLITVLLFALTCLVLYRVLLRLFAHQGSTAAALLAWVATLLFTAHPIHTEVVNNIKGCDEIVTLLGCLTALWCTFKAVDTDRFIWKLAAGASFFLACLSKENAAAFVLLIPLALWFSQAPASTTDKEENPSIVAASGPIWLAFALFFILRGSILHWKFGVDAPDLMNNPFLKFTGTAWVPFAAAEKLAAIFYTLGKYILLLFVPHPLTHDYYPRVIGMVSFANPLVLFSLAAYGYLGYQAVKGLRERKPLQLGIWMYLLPLGIVSNFFFPIGTNMGERFAFMPSVGFCIAIAALLVHWARAGNLKTMLYLLGAVCLLFSLKTVVRNTAWSSNEKLFFTDVGTSDNSAKIHNACGGILFDRANKETNPEKRLDDCRQAVVHLTKALEIYPNYKDAYISRGGANFYLKNYDAAIADYRQAVHFGPDDPRWKTYLAMTLRDGAQYYGEQKNDLATAQRYLSESWQINNQDAQTARLFGVANGVQGKHADAIAWFQKAVALDPKNASYLYDLGTAYFASGDAANGARYRQEALTLDPKLLEKR
ncbi:MAG: tetratricopeptide repeat protein, partial [Saprospiraceae bacterium]